MELHLVCSCQALFTLVSFICSVRMVRCNEGERTMASETARSLANI